MIILKKEDFPNEDAFLTEIKKYKGEIAEACLNKGLTVSFAGFAFDRVNGILAFARLKRDNPKMVRFELSRGLARIITVSQFHTIEIHSRSLRSVTPDRSSPSFVDDIL